MKFKLKEPQMVCKLKYYHIHSGLENWVKNTFQIFLKYPPVKSKHLKIFQSCLHRTLFPFIFVAGFAKLQNLLNLPIDQTPSHRFKESVAFHYISQKENQF